MGEVLVFSGTGWYRHPEVAAMSGWLVRLGEALEMQVDVSESGADLKQILPRYKVLVLNNCTEMTALLDKDQRQAVQAWYEAGLSPCTPLWCARQSGSGSTNWRGVISTAIRNTWKPWSKSTLKRRIILRSEVLEKNSSIGPTGPTMIEA